MNKHAADALLGQVQGKRFVHDVERGFGGPAKADGGREKGKEGK